MNHLYAILLAIIAISVVIVLTKPPEPSAFSSEVSFGARFASSVSKLQNQMRFSSMSGSASSTVASHLQRLSTLKNIKPATAARLTRASQALGAAGIILYAGSELYSTGVAANNVANVFRNNGSDEEKANAILDLIQTGGTGAMCVASLVNPVFTGPCLVASSPDILRAINSARSSYRNFLEKSGLGWSFSDIGKIGSKQRRQSRARGRTGHLQLSDGFDAKYGSAKNGIGKVIADCPNGVKAINVKEGSYGGTPLLDVNAHCVSNPPEEPKDGSRKWVNAVRENSMSQLKFGVSDGMWARSTVDKRITWIGHPNHGYLVNNNSGLGSLDTEVGEAIEQVHRCPAGQKITKIGINANTRVDSLLIKCG
jgi:hypothetical protein